MRPARTQLYLLPSEESVSRTFRSGVSLHSHTEHSQERLGTLPRYLQGMPIISQFTQWEIERYKARTGKPPDFSRAYWRGPLSARSAYDLERRQIERLGLAAMVSLTDHDNIDAGLLLQRQSPAGAIPISVEWTIPYEQSYFHVGVHNLLPARATTFMQRMAEYTRTPQPSVLGALLEDLAADPALILVLNHPLWDMAGIGFESTLALVRQFLRMHGPRIHALEINGLRAWQENMGVISLAQQSGHPVVAGGDRHGCEPNATVNLTRATSFTEFAEEIRVERSSEIAVLPQYREPLVLRHFLTAWDAVREHPQLADRQRWIARVFVLCDDGIERPLSQVWTEGAPGWIDPCLRVIGLLASRPLRAPFRLTVPVAGSAML
jgi:hypothetical protein